MFVAISLRQEKNKHGNSVDVLESAYTTFFNNMGITLIPIPNDTQNVKKLLESIPIKGIILSGGNDINPTSFGEEVQERRSDGNVFHGLGYTNNEPELFNHLVEKYKNSRKPVHIIVVHDGGIHKSREIEQIIRASSNYPIFWQFLGWGGKDYGILEHLDDMKGRDVDNCDFSAIEMKQIDKKGPEGDAFFLHLMTKETPGWLKKVLRRNWIDAAFCRSIAARLQ